MATTYKKNAQTCLKLKVRACLQRLIVLRHQARQLALFLYGTLCHIEKTIMKIIFSILSLLLFISCSKNQKTDCNYIKDYYPKIYEAELNYNEKNYQKAFELYSEAFISCELKNTVGKYEMDKFAEVSAILGKEKIALNFIQKNIEQGMLLRSFLNNPVLLMSLKLTVEKK